MILWFDSACCRLYLLWFVLQESGVQRIRGGGGQVDQAATADQAHPNLPGDCHTLLQTAAVSVTSSLMTLFDMDETGCWSLLGWHVCFLFT